jgi:hypothetical protein
MNFSAFLGVLGVLAVLELCPKSAANWINSFFPMREIAALAPLQSARAVWYIYGQQRDRQSGESGAPVQSGAFCGIVLTKPIIVALTRMWGHPCDGEW